MIKLDYSEQEQVLVPQGDYEFIIKSADVAETKSGTESILAVCVIRNDVEQEAKNRTVFHRIYRKKEPTPLDMEFDGFNAKQITELCKAVGLPNGGDYESLQEILFIITGGCFRAELYHDEFNGKTSEKIKFPKPSNYPVNNHVWKKVVIKSNGIDVKGDESFASAGSANLLKQNGMEEITDDVIPF
ncbi:MAG: DUF669 domain-containing protein [Oscillospiraceae bacterium]|nr:DUF669 domain-containing protein [Oscillospiraceae bacterium]